MAYLKLIVSINQSFSQSKMTLMILTSDGFWCRWVLDFMFRHCFQYRNRTYRIIENCLKMDSSLVYFLQVDGRWTVISLTVPFKVFCQWKCNTYFQHIYFERIRYRVTPTFEMLCDIALYGLHSCKICRMTILVWLPSGIGKRNNKLHSGAWQQTRKDHHWVVLSQCNSDCVIWT